MRVAALLPLVLLFACAPDKEDTDTGVDTVDDTTDDTVTDTPDDTVPDDTDDTPVDTDEDVETADTGMAVVDDTSVGIDTGTIDTGTVDTGSAAAVDADADGWFDVDDCDDHDPSIYPGAPELCDDIQQDCNGSGTFVAGTASFFPADGSPGSDVTSDLAGPFGWTVPAAGLVRSCGGSHNAAFLTVQDDVQIVSRDPANPATFRGGISLFGADAALVVSDVVMEQASFSSVGGTTQPAHVLQLDNVQATGTTAAVMFSGPFDLHLTDADIFAPGQLLNANAGLTALRTTFDVDTVYSGLVPFIQGFSASFTEVTSSTTTGGWLLGSAAHVVRDSTFTARGQDYAMFLGWDGAVVEDSTFISDYAGTEGSPLLIVGAAGPATLNGVTFEMAGDRGGLQLGGNSAGPLTCDDCVFRQPANQAAVSNANTGNLVISNSTFEGIFGIPVFDVQRFVHHRGTGTLTISDSTFDGGFAADGGGAVLVDRGTLLLTDSTFTANGSGDIGGAVLVGDPGLGGFASIGSGTVFDTNSASTFGGAVFTYGTLVVDGATFEDNNAPAGGGAVVAGSISQNHSVSNATFVRNTSNNAGVLMYAVGSTNSLIVTDTDFGAGADDNTTHDVQSAFLINGSISAGALTYNDDSGAPVTFTCVGSLLCN
jgi:hypothetical protein